MTTVAKTRPEVPDEKRERFVTLSKTRTDRALKSLDLIGNLSSANYAWNTSEVKKLMRELRKGIERVEGRFKRSRQWRDDA